MNSMKKLVVSVIAAVAASSAAHADPEKATVIHWWTSGGESAAIKQFADAYNKAGGLWVDQAVAGADQARSTAINRIMGGTRRPQHSSIRRSNSTTSSTRAC